MINIKRRNNIKKFGAVLIGVLLLRFAVLEDLFKDKPEKNNPNFIYSDDNKLMVSIE